MAKAKFGMIVTDMRNKLGGHVFSKNRSGAIVRTKVTPSNPQTPRQSLVRSYLTQMSQAWAGLTAEQRDSWNSAVSDWQRTDIFGDLKKPSGKNLFTALNINLLNTGHAIIQVAPQKADFVQLFTTSAVISITDGEITFNALGLLLGKNVLVSSTGAISAGISYTRGRYRQIYVLTSATGYETALYDDYVARFGLPVVGQNIWLEVKMIDSATGQAGPPIHFLATIEA